MPGGPIPPGFFPVSIFFSAGINAYCMLLEKIGIDVTYKGR
jgi:hypothetical protein